MIDPTPKFPHVPVDFQGNRVGTSAATVWKRRQHPNWQGPLKRRERPRKLDDASLEFWERIRAAMAVAKVTFNEWADECGIMYHNIRSLERRAKRPPDNELDALCSLTGTTRKWLEDPRPVDIAERQYSLRDIENAAVDYAEHDPSDLEVLQSFIRAMREAEGKFNV